MQEEECVDDTATYSIAFPRHRAMANRANKCLVARDGSREQEGWPMALPRVRNVWVVSSALSQEE